MAAERNIVTQFKEKIDFEDSLEQNKLLKSVVVSWPLPTIAPQLSSKNWQILASSVVSYEGFVKASWTLKLEQETISIQIAVSSEGNEIIQELFLTEATTTMMSESPYDNTDSLIGNLSVYVESEDLTSYLWIYQNVLFQIEGMFTTADIEGFSRWLQTKAEESLVDDLLVRLPPLDFIKIEPSEELKINDSFSIQAIQNESSNGYDSAYTFDYKHEPFEALELLSENGNTATYRATEAGPVDIKIHIIDPKTLLSRLELFSIDVGEG